MGFRFRKSFKIAPGIRTTISKSGISTRIGGKGFSVSKGKRGTRMNVGIPGTGISYSTKISGNSKAKSTPNATKRAVLNNNNNTQTPKNNKFKKYLLSALGILIGISMLRSCVSGNDSKLPAETSKNIQETKQTVTSVTAPKSEWDKWGYNENAEYFKSNKYVNEFFIRYNNVADDKIVKENIDNGNIRTKAHVSQSGWYITILNPNDNPTAVNITIEAEEHESIFDFYKNCIKSVDNNVTDKELQTAWDTIHNSDERSYSFNFVSVEYHQGISYVQERIEMVINLEEYVE